LFITIHYHISTAKLWYQVNAYLCAALPTLFQ
jgi:hypothetical protein